MALARATPRWALALVVLSPLFLNRTAVGQAVPDTLVFERLISPFEILDDDGWAYEHPFFGGFTHPRPQLVDLTGNGRLDLVVQEVFDRLIVYENVGKEGELRFEWRSDDWLGHPVGSWFRFGDLTGDGLPDLIANLPPGRVRFYSNVGTAERPAFESAAEPLLDTEGRPVAAEDPNVPALADIDGDGRLDAFMGQADRGYIRYYRHAGLDVDGVPALEMISNRWQNIEIYEANPTCDPFQEPVIPPTPDAPEGGDDNSRGSRHGENALAFADVDGDGTLDLFWGDFFTPSLYYFSNLGTPSEPLMSFVAPRFPLDRPLTSGGYNAPAFGDLDGDGRLDLVIGIVGGFCSTTANLIDNLYLLRNVGTPTEPAFDEVTGRLIHGLDVGRVAIPVFVDVDGDGTLDLVIGSAYNPREGGPRRGSLFLYLNRGTDDEPRYELATDDFLALDLDFANHYAPAFVDLTGDGRLDLVVGTFGGRLFWLENRSQFGVIDFAEPEPLVDSDGRPLNIGQTVVPTFADLNGDGLPDLVAGQFRGGLRHYRNVGRPGAPLFELASDTYLDVDVGRFTAPHLVDLTGNGLPDLTVGSERHGVHIYLNHGSAGSPDFRLAATVDPGRAQLAPTSLWRPRRPGPDLVVGTRAGGLIYLRNASKP